MDSNLYFSLLSAVLSLGAVLYGLGKLQGSYVSKDVFVEHKTEDAAKHADLKTDHERALATYRTEQEKKFTEYKEEQERKRHEGQLASHGYATKADLEKVEQRILSRIDRMQEQQNKTAHSQSHGRNKPTSHGSEGE